MCVSGMFWFRTLPSSADQVLTMAMTSIAMDLLFLLTMAMTIIGMDLLLMFWVLAIVWRP